MTTDLTGGSDLNEEEFDWDVFAPDPDEAEIAAEAAALEDRAELNLDDSHFDWEAALQEPETMGGADGEARAGAAFDRIVDTVRRSVEDPEAETEDAEAETEDADEIAEAHGPEAAATGMPWPDLDDELDPDHVLEPGAVPRTEPVHEAPATAVAAFESRADEHGRQAPDEEVAPWAEPDLSQEGAWDPRPEPEPRPVPIFEPQSAAVVAVPAAPTCPAAFEAEPEAAPWSASSEPVREASDDTAEVPTKGRSRRDGRRQSRSRVFTATVVLAVLVLVGVAAVVAVRSLHHSTAGTPSATAHSQSAPRVSPSPDAARMQSATDAVDSATTAAQVGLTSLSTFPTTGNVAKVIYPYISSLQLYESFLAGSTVPAPARAAAASAATQVRQELTFLDTVAALPPDQLGAYLQQFGTDSTRLQTTLGVLEHDLGTSSP